jgi:hypothetical protein
MKEARVSTSGLEFGHFEENIRAFARKEASGENQREGCYALLSDTSPSCWQKKKI